jgi:hypothetical protein
MQYNYSKRKKLSGMDGIPFFILGTSRKWVGRYKNPNPNKQRKRESD